MFTSCRLAIDKWKNFLRVFIELTELNYIQTRNIILNVNDSKSHYTVICTIVKIVDSTVSG